MPPTRFVPRNPDEVKAHVLGVFEHEVVDLLSMMQEDSSVRDLEGATRRTMIKIWTVLLSSLGLLCRAVALKAIRRAGLTLNEVKFRFDRDYWISLRSSMGPVLVPLFAYRAPTPEGMRAQTPARALFPLHPACLSTVSTWTALCAPLPKGHALQPSSVAVAEGRVLVAIRAPLKVLKMKKLQGYFP
jgi:hypothetical protein